ncbi:MAG: ribbon-helix-helix protein, CopG family [Pantoea sp.]|uniref:ribbon-helix-helix protein, CopG family n=1 Tax=Pantoea sp. TaxID=69393 RepID=UPI0039E43BA7
MIQSASDIQKRSDEKRGAKPKTYKLPLQTIDRIELLASDTGVSQAAIIATAIDIYEQSLKRV